MAIPCARRKRHAGHALKKRKPITALLIPTSNDNASQRLARRFHYPSAACAMTDRHRIRCRPVACHAKLQPRGSPARRHRRLMDRRKVANLYRSHRTERSDQIRRCGDPVVVCRVGQIFRAQGCLLGFRHPPHTQMTPARRHHSIQIPPPWSLHKARIAPPATPPRTLRGAPPNGCSTGSRSRLLFEGLMLPNSRSVSAASRGVR